METSFNHLPDEIVDAIVNECGSNDLAALARSCKRLARIVPPKLYRHLYYRYVGVHESDSDSDRCVGDVDVMPDSDTQLADARKPQNNWRCGRCPGKCADGLFNNKDDDDIGPTASWIVDLPRFAEVISQRPDRRSLIQSMRLDSQSPRPISGDGDYEELQHILIDSQKRLDRWYLGHKLERAIESISSGLSHLQLQRAYFSSACSEECVNARSILTLGMPLPFFLLLSGLTTGAQDPIQDGPRASESPKLFEIECIIADYDVARINYSSHPPQVAEVEERDVEECLVLQHYTGPLNDLGAILGYPLELEPYRRWLLERPEIDFQTNSIRATTFRILREESEFQKHSDDPAYNRYRNLLVGDVSSLIFDESLNEPFTRWRGHPSPDKVLLSRFLLEGDTV